MPCLYLPPRRSAAHSIRLRRVSCGEYTLTDISSRLSLLLIVSEQLGRSTFQHSGLLLTNFYDRLVFLVLGVIDLHRWRTVDVHSLYAHIAMNIARQAVVQPGA